MIKFHINKFICRLCTFPCQYHCGCCGFQSFCNTITYLIVIITTNFYFNIEIIKLLVPEVDFACLSLNKCVLINSVSYPHSSVIE